MSNPINEYLKELKNNPNLDYNENILGKIQNYWNKKIPREKILNEIKGFLIKNDFEAPILERIASELNKLELSGYRDDNRDHELARVFKVHDKYFKVIKNIEELLENTKNKKILNVNEVIFLNNQIDKEFINKSYTLMHPRDGRLSTTKTIPGEVYYDKEIFNYIENWFQTNTIENVVALLEYTQSFNPILRSLFLKLAPDESLIAPYSNNTSMLEQFIIKNDLLAIEILSKKTDYDMHNLRRYKNSDNNKNSELEIYANSLEIWAKNYHNIKEERLDNWFEIGIILLSKGRKVNDESIENLFTQYNINLPLNYLRWLVSKIENKKLPELAEDLKYLQNIAPKEHIKSFWKHQKQKFQENYAKLNLTNENNAVLILKLLEELTTCCSNQDYSLANYQQTLISNIENTINNFIKTPGIENNKEKIYLILLCNSFGESVNSYIHSEYFDYWVKNLDYKYQDEHFSASFEASLRYNIVKMLNDYNNTLQNEGYLGLSAKEKSIVEKFLTKELVKYLNNFEFKLYKNNNNQQQLLDDFSNKFQSFLKDPANFDKQTSRLSLEKLFNLILDVVKCIFTLKFTPILEIIKKNDIYEINPNLSNIDKELQNKAKQIFIDNSLSR